ncbi:MAG: signal peptidase II [candidate division WOR-3 bacterium]
MKKALLIFLCVFAIDRITKYIVVSKIPYGHDVNMVGEFVRITHVRNPNSLWSISLGERFPYVFVGLLALILLTTLIVEAIKSRQEGFACVYALLLAGVAGNIIDRIRFKEVIDFIDIGISPALRWPVFNVADSAISIGLVLYFIMLVRERSSKRSK